MLGIKHTADRQHVDFFAWISATTNAKRYTRISRSKEKVSEALSMLSWARGSQAGMRVLSEKCIFYTQK